MKYRYTVCMDDASKLCGYSEQVFQGESIGLEEYKVLLIFQPDGCYTNINFDRVRWYRCEPLRDAATTVAGARGEG